MRGRSPVAMEVFPMPDLSRIESCRAMMTEFASSQVLTELRQPLLEMLECLHRVDAQVLRVLDGVSSELRSVDIEEYRSAVATLDKEGRTERENRAFIHFQQEVAEELQRGMQAARHHVRTLDESLSALARVSIADNPGKMKHIEELLAGMKWDDVRKRSLERQLQDLKGPLLVARARQGYIHEVEKLVFAMYGFLEGVLQASPHVIQRADDFQQHASVLVDYMQTLRRDWKS